MMQGVSVNVLSTRCRFTFGGNGLKAFRDVGLLRRETTVVFLQLQSLSDATVTISGGDTVCEGVSGLLPSTLIPSITFSPSFQVTITAVVVSLACNNTVGLRVDVADTALRANMSGGVVTPVGVYLGLSLVTAGINAVDFVGAGLVGDADVALRNVTVGALLSFAPAQNVFVVAVVVVSVALVVSGQSMANCTVGVDGSRLDVVAALSPVLSLPHGAVIAAVGIVPFFNVKGMLVVMYPALVPLLNLSAAKATLLGVRAVATDSLLSVDMLEGTASHICALGVGLYEGGSDVSLVARNVTFASSFGGSLVAVWNSTLSSLRVAVANCTAASRQLLSLEGSVVRGGAVAVSGSSLRTFAFPRAW
jgi:hypothetical protein